MKSAKRYIVVTAICCAVVLQSGVSRGWGQTVTSASRVSSAGGAGSPAAAGPAPGATQAPVADAHSEKQKELARQADQLFDMATELKAEVDKTNKNILSLKVVNEAEQIERLAKGMKSQAKR
jgi:hypothetical protein